MKKLGMVLVLASVMTGCKTDSPEFSEQKAYYNQVVKELSSAEYYGRSHYMDGDVKAADYIIGELIRLGVGPAPAAAGVEVPVHPEYKSEVKPAVHHRWEGKDPQKLAYLQHFTYPMNTLRGDMKIVVDGRELSPTVDYVAKEFSGSAHGFYDVAYLDNKYLTTDGFVRYMDDGKYKNTFVVVDWDEYQKRLDFHPFERYAPYLQPLRKLGGVILKGSSENLFPYFKARSYYTTHVPVFLTTSDFPSDARQIEVHIDNEMIPDKDGHNILAYIPGTKNPEKCLMISGHYDHLGLMGRDNVFPGANDDASGVALMLTLARYYQENRPDYSVMFLFTDAEEENLLGAFYYAENPRIPLENVFAFVELDMIADNGDHLDIQISEQGESLMKMFEDVNKGMSNPFGSMILEDLNDDSDHYPFALKKVPVFYMSVGGDYHKHYHTPRDIYENSSDANFGRFYELMVDFSSKASSLY